MTDMQREFCSDVAEEMLGKLYLVAKTPRGKVAALGLVLELIEVELQARKEEIA